MNRKQKLSTSSFLVGKRQSSFGYGLGQFARPVFALTVERRSSQDPPIIPVLFSPLTLRTGLSTCKQHLLIAPFHFLVRPVAEMVVPWNPRRRGEGGKHVIHFPALHLSLSSLIFRPPRPLRRRRGSNHARTFSSVLRQAKSFPIQRNGR